MGNDDEISPEEQAQFRQLSDEVNKILLGTTTNMCLSVLSAVAAHICAEFDHPQEAGLSFVGEFLHYLEHEIDEIPAESVIDIPETN